MKPTDMNSKITVEAIRNRLWYEKESGKLFWKNTNYRQSHLKGKRAGCIDSVYGYRRIGFNGILYAEHRIIWMYVHGTWPKGELDHINGNKADNRIENLRDTTRSLNALNLHVWKKRKMPRGVEHHRQKYRARIRINKQLITLGYFKTAKEASDMYEAKRKELLA